MVWTCLRLTSNDLDEKNLLCVGRWHLMEKPYVKKDMNGSSKDSFEKIKPLCE